MHNSSACRESSILLLNHICVVHLYKMVGTLVIVEINKADHFHHDTISLFHKINYVNTYK